ncbi:MAG TPA: tRNA isopentenyl-2-thiomethyl-A-37 hydroxylase MiaE [Kofleriaceae bacterium]|nr:tRNA isopentenyl-2-thiomethyl-A-37 hydroxylase MiaE [Kofleriaceae bacterium]
MNSSEIAVPPLPISATDQRWVGVALADLDALLCDHLHCERKAAQSALSLVRSYPDRPQLSLAVARLAHEETSHVLQVSQLLARRRIGPRPDHIDDYARALRAHVRKREPERLIDSLLVFALIEARSAERLALLGEALASTAHGPELAPLYRTLAAAELRHRDLFVRLAFASAPAGTRGRVRAAAEVAARLAELAAAEAAIVAGLPLRARIH